MIKECPRCYGETFEKYSDYWMCNQCSFTEAYQRIVLPLAEFKEFIEGIREVDTTYYKGDWDYGCYTSYEIREDGIYQKWYYINNGVKPPPDGERKIMEFEILE